MSILRFSSAEAFCELGVTVEGDRSLPSFGDAYITLKVHSKGYCGQNNLWVQSGVMSTFCSSLMALDRSLKGEAVLESMSPNELVLKVFSVNSRGQLAVEGTTGHHFVGGDRTFWHAVSFGFEFENSQLSGGVRLPWVQRYAAG